MYKEVTNYLSTHNITYKTSGDKTEAIINCLFCEDTKFHLYINNLEGCFLCHKCGTEGSWKNLVEKLGDNSLPQLENTSRIEYSAELETTTFDSSLIKEYHQNLPERIREYFKSDKRGLTDDSIDEYKIGWDDKSKSITIPVYDHKGNLVNIRHRRDPQRSSGPKIWGEKGGKASLFNIKALELVKKQDNPAILITEGEFDAMIATQYGFPAVSSTAGAATFKEEWVKDFDGIETIYIGYDTDQAGKDGAKKVALLFGDRAKIVNLPSNEGEKVDITEYFVHLKHTTDDFQQLLDDAETLETTSDEFELLDSDSQIYLHPALDFYENQLYLTLPLPVRFDKQETVKQVVISSNRHKALIIQNCIDIDGNKIQLRKVSSVPGDKLRWKLEDLQRFLSEDKATTVSAALVFIEIRQALLKFVDFRKESDADILTLWLMGTYFFPIFDAYPYIYLVGVKRSGKTKTLLIIEKLAFNAILSSNISPAVLFRLVEARRCTLALDESEQLADKTKKEELRELLNAGYKRGAPAYRVRKNSKNDFEIEAFEVYGPKAIANIAGLDSVLEDRAITITMVRTDNPDKGNLAVTERAENWVYLRSLLYSFALTHAKAVADIYHQDPDVNALLNRQNELWRPLLSIAKVVDTKLPGTFTRIRDEAIRRAEETSGNDLEDFDSAVLLALRSLVDAEVEASLTNKKIREKALEYLEEDQYQYFTSRGVGAALKRFGIRGKKIQGSWIYTINQDVLTDLLSRYGL